ncbi:HEAT repeat domain-containing protein [Candidatus Uabimicrobium sp. HlEnr_7]|uniref:HEAT repeat domain-containing protein n=1 Tax=Candidatus Uabimicrobium helgolandensis TaxID=3095367 RepID=UPI003558A6E3
MKILVYIAITMMFANCLKSQEIIRLKNVKFVDIKKDFRYWAIDAISKSKDKQLLIKMLKHSRLRSLIKRRLDDPVLIRILVKEAIEKQEKHMIKTLYDVSEYSFNKESVDVIADTLIKNFSNLSPELQINVVRTLSNLSKDNQKIQAFLLSLLRDPQPSIIKIEIVNVLYTTSYLSKLIPLVDEYLQGKDAILKYHILRIIGNANLKRFLPKLYLLIKDTNSDIRIGALSALNIMIPKTEKLRSYAEDMFFKDEDPWVKNVALEILHKKFSGAISYSDEFYLIVTSDKNLLSYTCNEILKSKKILIKKDIKILKRYLNQDDFFEEATILLLSKISEYDKEVVQLLIKHASTQTIIKIGKKFPLKTVETLKEEYSRQGSLDEYDFNEKKYNILYIFESLGKTSAPALDLLLTELKRKNDWVLHMLTITALCAIKQPSIMDKIFDTIDLTILKGEQERIIKALISLAQNKSQSKDVVRFLSKSFLDAKDAPKLLILEFIEQVQFFDDAVAKFLFSCLDLHHEQNLQKKTVEIISQLESKYIRMLSKKVIEEIKKN